MAASQFVNVRRPLRGTGRLCQHCKKRATTIAVRKTRWAKGHTTRRDVAYCDDHAAQIIEEGATSEAR